MFGFLRSCRNDPRYAFAYKRCCQHQHLHYGAWSLPFLSYEAVFAYLLASESGVVEGWRIPTTSSPSGRCCRLQASRRLLQEADAGLGRYCAAMGLILADVKLEDDVRDGRSWTARAARRSLRRAIAGARRLFTDLDSGFNGVIRGLIQQHLQLENPSRRISLSEYVRPTADAFEYVFGLAGRIGRSARTTSREWIAEVGRRVGAAIIAFDCAVDWPRDQARGEYNPLEGEADVREALALSADELQAGAQLVRAQVGDQAAAGEVLVRRARGVSSLSTACHPLTVIRNRWSGLGDGSAAAGWRRGWLLASKVPPSNGGVEGTPVGGKRKEKNQTCGFFDFCVLPCACCEGDACCGGAAADGAGGCDCPCGCDCSC